MTGVSVDIPLEARRCENCACYFEVRNPLNPLQCQGFCRREPPQSQQVRVDVPMMNGKGEPMIDAKGKPRMEQKIQLAFVHELTARQMTCFDGWRPLGTQPGDDWRRDADLVRTALALTVIPPAANDSETPSAT
jgi:hypothetical protein